jgi:2-oxoglutarate ferredoxin oxidoreductase subunit delta
MDTSHIVTKNGSTGRQKKKGTMEISIERKWCKNCGICVEFCPKNVFTLGKLNEPIISASEDCTNCHLCELRCPEFAITVIETEAKANG